MQWGGLRLRLRHVLISLCMIAGLQCGIPLPCLLTGVESLLRREERRRGLPIAHKVHKYSHFMMDLHTVSPLIKETVKN